MFWKPAKPWPLTVRLTVLYIASAFLLLSLITGFLYWFLVGTLRGESRQMLNDEIRILRSLLRDHTDDTDALEEEIRWEETARRHTALYSRVLDSDGSTLIESLSMDDLPISAFPSAVGILEMPNKTIKWKIGDERSYLLTSAWAQLGTEGPDRYRLQVALDVSREEGLIVRYRWSLAFVLATGVLLSGVAGVIVARRGMRPLAKITQMTQKISASGLHQRIGSETWPKELMSLVAGFDDMLDRLEDSFKRLSQFSGDLAHELRTPINNLVGEAEVALSRARTSEEYRQVLVSSLEEYEKLSHLIKNLLFLARSESTQLQVERSFFEARKEIQTVIEFHEAVAEEQRVGVSCHGDATVYADPHLFRRAVSNLLSNALQYTPPGGRIDIAVASADRQDVEIHVRDNGSGIDPKDLPKIFDRFYRGDPARSKSREGTGLGLSIVKSIMDLHHGSVRIESIPAKGTTATLTFLSLE